MREYPKVVSCGFTGVVAVVRDEAEEREFRRTPLWSVLAAVVVALAVGLIFAVRAFMRSL